MPADPKIADLAPSAHELTSYDKEHAIIYMRLLDADADKADWREIARIVLGLDPTVEPDRARRTFESHLARAEWLAGHGYRDLLRGGWPKE
ncbi:DNA -binding domain-containing protein [Bradyrhizobium sp. BR 1432]|uniref:DNA -binding domain-containing protein n=1 Tax=Bradyrhizobium sp. BR 1432 TaxID=3447966 RepID=UPI003EE5304B